MRIRIDVFGEEVLDRAFSRFGEGIDDFEELGIWEDVGKDYREIQKQQFANEGYGWQELSAKYAKWKAVHYPGKPLMRRTDALFHSLTRPGASGAVFDAKPKELTLGSTVPYAAYHMRPFKRRPARKPIDLREADKRQITKTIHRGLVKFSSKVGFVQTGSIN